VIGEFRVRVVMAAPAVNCARGKGSMNSCAAIVVVQCNAGAQDPVGSVSARVVVVIKLASVAHSDDVGLDQFVHVSWRGAFRHDSLEPGSSTRRATVAAGSQDDRTPQ